MKRVNLHSNWTPQLCPVFLPCRKIRVVFSSCLTLAPSPLMECVWGQPPLTYCSTCQPAPCSEGRLPISCLSVYLSVCLSISLSVSCLSVYLSACLCLSVYLSACLCLSVYLSVCLSISLPVSCLSVYLSACLCLSVYLPCRPSGDRMSKLASHILKQQWSVTKPNVYYQLIAFRGELNLCGA